MFITDLLEFCLFYFLVQEYFAHNVLFENKVYIWLLQILHKYFNSIKFKKTQKTSEIFKW